MKVAKKALVIALFLALALGCKKAAGSADTPPKPGKSPYKDLKSQVSYIIGFDIGKNLKDSKLEVSSRIMEKGIVDAYNGKTSVISEEEKQAIMVEFQAYMEKKQADAGIAAQKEGVEFLDKNKTKAGITTLPSGLQYRVITEGNGPIPVATDSVSTHYTGKLIDGTEFDSSIKRGEPAVFGIGDVIPGWQEALLLMKVGSKWEIFIPSELAYGEQGAGAAVPPNSTLIFEMELLKIGE